MYDHAIIMNTARGPVVDKDVLVATLKDGNIAGAGLYIRDSEPPQVDPLSKFENIILSPHAGFYFGGSTPGTQ